jgi:hypothetical protein
MTDDDVANRCAGWRAGIAGVRWNEGNDWQRLRPHAGKELPSPQQVREISCLAADAPDASVIQVPQLKFLGSQSLEARREQAVRGNTDGRRRVLQTARRS